MYLDLELFILVNFLELYQNTENRYRLKNIILFSIQDYNNKK